MMKLARWSSMSGSNRGFKVRFEVPDSIITGDVRFWYAAACEDVWKVPPNAPDPRTVTGAK
jgi:hypothetical protein